MKKVILILIDGLGFQTMIDHCGYLEGRLRAGTTRRTRLLADLPSMSRPIYETLHTGVPIVQHGITTNDVYRLTNQQHIFSLVRQAGGSTAAAASIWFSELYNRAPHDPLRDAIQSDPSRAIQNGVFIVHEATPDAEPFHAASALIHTHSPDYMLLHPSMLDHIGHKHGGRSKEYRTHATKVDTLIAQFAPAWEQLGYRIMVTADHGMNEDGYHGGTRDDVRHIAFYDFGSAMPGIADEDAPQTAVAPTILKAMGLEIPDAMKAAPLV